jgi:hypothetical protein
MKMSETSNCVYVIILTIFIILSGSSECKAKAPVYSFEEIADKSDIIVIAKVRKVRNSIFCENVAYVEPVSIIKGKSEDTRLKIKFGNLIFTPREDTTRLDVGEIYVFFLYIEDSYFRITGLGLGYYHVKDGESVCFRGNYIKTEDFIKKILSK